MESKDNVHVKIDLTSIYALLYQILADASAVNNIHAKIYEKLFDADESKVLESIRSAAYHQKFNDNLKDLLSDL